MMLDYFRFRFYGPITKASGLLEIDTMKLKPGGTLYFRIKNEKPFEDLEVESGYTKTFTHVSPESFFNALKLRIYHIAWKSKVVLLIERYEVDELQIYKQLQDICTFEEFKDKIEKLKELPEDFTSSSTDWERHPLGIIESLTKRLDQVQKIKNRAHPNRSDIPFAKSGLVLFILCTCIETLGRTHEFISYHDWLVSKRTSEEVQNTIQHYKDEDYVTILIKVHNEYLDRYGFRRSFYNFFNDLDKESQDKLSNTVMIITNKPPKFEPEIIGEPFDNLIKFLEDFRHNFAHRMESKYAVSLEEELPVEDSDISEYTNMYMGSYQKKYDDGSFETVLARDLISKLSQIIRLAIWNSILKQVNEK